MNGQAEPQNATRDAWIARAVGMAAVTAVAVLAVLAGLAGCSTDGISSSRPAAQHAGPADLNIVAGSEVKDMLPILEDAQRELGISVDFTYMGTLDGTEAVMAGGTDYDATWFPSNAYMSLFDRKSSLIAQEASIMRTPIVLGMKRDKAAELGFDKQSPTWSAIVDAASSGRFAFGMSSPVSSNSGFSTLVELATALSGTGSAITEADVDAVKDSLREFAKGQALASGSSGWLMEAYAKDGSKVDGVFNYESLIKQDPDLVEVVPQDGVITADYPLTLLSGRGDQANDAYRKLVDYLKRDDVQQRIADETLRRTSASSAADATEAFEIPFPNRLDAVHALLSTWVSEVRKPANMVFQIDTSGSMSGVRLDELKSALFALADPNGAGSSSLLAFQPRESILLVEFASTVKSTALLDIDETGDTSEVVDQIADLRAKGGTAIYNTLEESLERAAVSANDGNVTSVVLFTDGENTEGANYREFERWYRSHESVQGIPVYTILFAEGSKQEMQKIADLTGGRVFDAENGDLTAAFKEIRGYL
ncbi:hypothetical protein C1878_15115 [Gordonibacter sp. 28C]|uniref:vWA domain-containing protein n=1 Tax=Gordonibacter sp. 28C TaxID=2078569 RepID=UPI000DF798BD|nr:VWA domain-containing protein [Gordonibacter sp. 28C]RDB59711.1 hypothetical protein C1878_15115 [Gordonibacter sp. 28C]